MTTFATLRRVVCLVFFSGLLAATCEAGSYQIGAGTVDTTSATATYYIKVIATDSSYQQVALPNHPVTFQQALPNTPMPGVTTYHHTWDPLSVAQGNYVNVTGYLYVVTPNGPSGGTLIGTIQFNYVP